VFVYCAVADAEIIVVDDDSQDGTVEEVAGLRQEGYNISVLVRQEKGLSTAVLAGFELANNEVCPVVFYILLPAHVFNWSCCFSISVWRN
jgi:glycosyltransferase involved in cell wall biosynthesis